MLKQILAVVAGAGLALGVFAADVQLKEGHPDTYIVQKGDTLWDISGRFLSKPWLWPEIWQANPQVANPHLIYPGDQLNLIWVDGKPRLINGGAGPDIRPRMRAQPLADATTTVALGDVLPFLEKVRIVDQAEYESLPYVVALEEGHLRGTPGQAAYVRGLEAAPGTRVLIVRATNEYREVPVGYPWQDERRRVEARSLDVGREYQAPDWYWLWSLNWASKRKTEYLGTEVMEIAQGEVLRGGDPSSVLLQVSDLEIRAGDRVIVGGSMPFDLTFFPRAPKSVPDDLRVVSLSNAMHSAGPKQVIALTRGARDGLAHGDVFAVYRPGDEVVDEIKHPEGSFRRALTPGRTKVRLPEEFVGHAMVFRTFDRVSYALIMDAIRPVQPGDVLREPVN
jgi:hypothetical protein